MAARSDDVSYKILSSGPSRKEFELDSSLSPIVVHSIDIDGALLSSLYAKLVSDMPGIELIFDKIYHINKVDLKSIERNKKTLHDVINKNYEKVLSEEKFNATIKKSLEIVHAALIELICNLSKDAKTYIISGSNRQTRWLDSSNGKGANNGSSAVALLQFLNVIKENQPILDITLDSFLLEDIRIDALDGALRKKHGTHFHQLLDFGTLVSKLPDVKSRDKHTEYDDTKIILLYMQMHRYATLHPHQPITLHFYDDDPKADYYPEQSILQGLINFYTKNPDTIPKNVTLHLHRYAGPQCEEIKSNKTWPAVDVKYQKLDPEAGIQGTGLINTGYEDTFQKLQQAFEAKIFTRHGVRDIEKFVQVLQDESAFEPTPRDTNTPVIAKPEKAPSRRLLSLPSSSFWSSKKKVSPVEMRAQETFIVPDQLTPLSTDIPKYA